MIKRLFTYLFFNGMQLIIGVISIPIVTNLMSPEEYGRVGLLLSALAIYVPILSLGSENYFPVELSKNTAFEDVRKTIYITAILVTLVSTIGMLLLKAFIDYDDIFLFLPFIALFRMMRIAQLSEVVYKENPVKFGVSNVGLASLTLFFSFVCIELFSGSAEGRALALFLAELLVASFLLKNFMEIIGKGQFSFVELKRAFLFSAPIILAIIPAWFVNEYGKVYLSSKVGLKEVGVLAIGMQLAAFQLQMNASVSNVFLRPLYDDISKAYSFTFNLKVIAIITVASFFGYIGVKLFADYIVSSEYKRSIEIVSLLLLGVYFQSLSVIPSLYMNYYKKTHLRLVSLSLSAILNFIALNMLSSSSDMLSFVVDFFAVSMFLYVLLMYFFLLAGFYNEKKINKDFLSTRS
ncbi:TPA: lipopolysaccharide biosynthesis protein [Vibrio diabolicus]